MRVCPDHFIVIILRMCLAVVCLAFLPLQGICSPSFQLLGTPEVCDFLGHVSVSLGVYPPVELLIAQ